MAAPKVKFKRSSVAGKIPALSNLETGELALNTYDGKLFLKVDKFSFVPSINKETF